jgi:TRAP transporter TAXI family solute receptor
MKEQVKKSYTRLANVFSRELLEASLPSIIFILIALVVGYKFIDPAPPRKIVISTGNHGGNYGAFASVYREYLKREGIALESRESGGDRENLQRLKDEKSGIDMAFVLDGIASTEGAGSLQSLGSLYYEPAWIFCRCKNEISHLSDLKGRKIAVGKEGSGTNILSMVLLNASGVNSQNSDLVSMDAEGAEQAILKGEVDAAIIVDVPNSSIIKEVLNDESIHLVSMDDAEAFTRQFRYLHHLTLPEGSIDIERNIPSHDIHLLSPVVTLVARGDMHPALVYLMLKVISQVHGGSGMLNKEKDFPSDKDNDFPLSDQAINFYKSGLPILDKYLPFWAATFVNRSLLVILPLLAILIPLTKIIPTVYIWLVKMKLYRYYGELRFLETQLRLSAGKQNHADYLDELNEIENKVNELKLPVAFSQHIYELRGHIELVRTKLERLDASSRK